MPNIRRDDSLDDRPEFRDAEKWDKRELGASEEFVSDAGAGANEKLDESLGLIPVTIRLPKLLVEELKHLSKSQGIKYQPYIRRLLTAHVEKRKSAYELSTASVATLVQEVKQLQMQVAALEKRVRKSG